MLGLCGRLDDNIVAVTNARRCPACTGRTDIGSLRMGFRRNLLNSLVRFQLTLYVAVSSAFNDLLLSESFLPLEPPFPESLESDEIWKAIRAGVHHSPALPRVVYQMPVPQIA